VRFDKKLDPRKLRFGSRIDNSRSTREKYYSVKDIISPEQLVIGDGLKVRLLGVRSRPRTHNEAVEFLRDRIRGQKVFMKFDAVKHDADNNLLCYLYLQNKTFLNAHLIKRGLVDVDTSMEYRLRSKFLEARKG
jgi:site-specific DNA-methyltransferase (adenine-specific)